MVNFIQSATISLYISLYISLHIFYVLFLGVFRFLLLLFANAGGRNVKKNCKNSLMCFNNYKNKLNLYLKK